MDKWLTKQVVDLDKGSIRCLPYGPGVVQGSVGSMVWEVEVLRSGQPADLNNATITAEIVRPDGATVILTGTREDNVARITLDQACCGLPGTLRGVMWASVGADEVVAVGWMRWEVLHGGTDIIVDPGEMLPTLSALMAELQAMREVTEQAREAVEQASTLTQGSPPTVYCWGDSLTEGVGGWLQTPEMVQKAIISAYPDMVARTYPCVNLGCRGETIQTIMARQGSDPMVVGGFTIPASSSESVAIGYLRGTYYSSDRLGIATKSGDVAQPLKECEAGINPCSIGGVIGELYRSMEKDSEDRYTYYFRRLEDGSAYTVPEGMEIETYAMKHYRNGVAVLWMGANGAVNSHTAYIEKIKQFIEYGNYKNYIVLLCREYAETWVPDIDEALVDEDGVKHFLYLKPELLRRGYTLAGIAASAGVPNTSGWTNTTDEIKLQRPLLMAATGSAESDYETLHFSPYGYKAIGKLVVEKLGQLIDVSRAPEVEEDPGYMVDGVDDYGTFHYKLTRPKTGSGQIVDTGFKPYDVEKDWTIFCQFSDSITATDNSTGSIFEMRQYFSDVRKQTAVFIRKIIGDPIKYNVSAGFGGFNFPFDNAPGYSASTDGWHYLCIIKNGGNYSFYLDGGLAYGSPLGYAVAPEHMSQETIRLFGRVENGNVLNTVKGTIADFRVYEGTMDTATMNAVITEMKEAEN